MIKTPTHDGRKIYRQITQRKFLIILGFAVFSILFMLVDVLTGVANIPVEELIACIFQPRHAISTTYVIIWKMRMPIAIMALIVGFALGGSGAVMQTILHNPLASPYTLGVGAGAGFGASLAIIIGWGSLGTSVMAFVFAMSISLLIYFLGRSGIVTSNTMVLSGIAILFLFQALQGLLQYSASETQNQSIVFWSFGSLQKTSWVKLAITTAVTTIAMPLIFKDSWKYTALSLGDAKAESLGIAVDQFKLKAFILISLLAAVSVCFTGTIGFIGLAGPHISRMLVGEDQRFYIPLSGLCGTALLSIASVLSKLIRPGLIFPIGIITSIIGIPFFFLLVFQSNRRRQS